MNRFSKLLCKLYKPGIDIIEDFALTVVPHYPPGIELEGKINSSIVPVVEINSSVAVASRVT